MISDQKSSIRRISAEFVVDPLDLIEHGIGVAVGLDQGAGGAALAVAEAGVGQEREGPLDQSGVVEADARVNAVDRRNPLDAGRAS